MPDNFVGDFNISVQGATNNTLGAGGQGVCGVNLSFDHEYLGDLSITLTSPAGQTVTLVGPIGFFGPTDGTTWDVSFVPCADPVAPDGTFSGNWNNNQPWGLNHHYSGTYHPSSGCLESFNTGSVNGTWSMTVTDGQAVDVGNFTNYEIVFCDPSGINCFSCVANGGNIPTPIVTACEGATTLNLNLPPTYNPPNSVEPPAGEYSYTYVIAGPGGSIIGYDADADLSAYPPGAYTVCGLSYLTADEGNLPAPGTLTTTQLNTQLASGQPPFCGDMSNGCASVIINPAPPDSEEDATICAPDCYLFHGQTYCQSGTYIKALTQNGCNYTATLNLTVLDVPPTNLTQTICNGECSDIFGFQSACSDGNYTQTYQSYLGCDSVVNLTLSVIKVQVDITPPIEIGCNDPSVSLVGMVTTPPSGTATYTWTATNGGHFVGPTNTLNTTVNTAGTYELTVCYTSGGMTCCSTATATVTERYDPPAAPDQISGVTVLCPGDNETFNITQVAPGGSYAWTVPPGVTINSGQGTVTLNVTWNSTSGGDICVSYTNACGTSDPTCLPISIELPAVPTQPTGSITACAGVTEHYQTTTIPNATGYVWTVTPPATIISGQGTTGINVNWGNSPTGSVCVSATSACGTSQPVCLPVQITTPPAAPVLTGSATGCSGAVATYSIAAVTGATSYNWVVTGGTITSGTGTTSVQVTWNANATSGSVCVTATNSCATSTPPTCQNVTLSALPAQPLISGNNATCQGTTGIYSIAPITGATGYTWTVPSGGTIVSGQNTTQLNVNWVSAPGGSICVLATGTCGPGPQFCFPVTVTTQPVANAGAGGTVCGTSFNLQATPSVTGSAGLWVLVPGAPGTASFVNPQAASTSVTVTQPGNYIFVWQEQLNTCTSDDSLTVSFYTNPVAGQITRTCDATNQNYTVSFPITGGTAPYTVPGGTVTGGVFTSSPIPSGNTYSFQVTDVHGCQSSVLTGSFSCSCSTNAGTMSLTPLSACQGSSVTATHTGGQTLDANDVTAYVLHTGSGNALGTVLGQNATGTFSFQTGMTYETTYYVSFVAGNNLNGQPNPADPCFSVAQGEPVVWHQTPTASAGTDANTCGLTLPLTGSPTTGGTWSVTSSPTGGTLSLNNAQSNTATATASGFGAYTLTWTVDNAGCTATDNVILTFNSSPTIGQITRTCDGANQNYTVSFPITGGTAPYTVPGGTVTNGVFTSNPIVSGNTYSFQVTDVNGCQSTVLTGSFSCSCSTNAGTMSLTPLSACQGSSVTATHTGGQTLDANDVTAYVLHTGSATTLGTIFGQNATGTFSFQNTMAYETTYYVSFIAGNSLNGQPDPNDPCFSVAQGQPVVWHANPTANAGVNADTCGLALPLTGNTGVGTGMWSVVSSPAGGTLSFANAQNTATTATASGFGTYLLAWTLDNAGCTDADTVQLAFNGTPITGAVVTTCDANNQNYTVNIPISGGTPPYMVGGAVTPGTTFTSTPIVSGNPYTYTISDANGCTAADVTGSRSCNCSTDAGDMATEALSACEGDSLTATHVGGENLDGNDVTAYVLHSGNSTALGTVFDENTTGTFNFQNGMAYGTTYYVSFVVGNNLNGEPDPADPCLSVAVGQPVVWNQTPVANAGMDADTCGLSLTLNGSSVTGKWTVSNAPAGATLVFTDDEDGQSGVTASANGAYTIIWTVSANGCSSSDEVDVQFNASPSLVDLARSCDAANENFTVSLTLMGGTPPYTVNNTEIPDSAFVSAPFANGQNYTFNISDVNGCIAPTINGAYSCNCSTDAGTMVAAQLQACEDQSITVTANNDQSLDGNDLTAYVLHDGSGPSLGNVLDQNTTGIFSFGSGMIFGKIYYVSLVAGNPLNGQPNPLDPCFSVAIGQPVVWLQNPTPNAGPDDDACGSTITLQAVSGSFPGVWSQVSGPDTTLFADTTLSSSVATISAPGTYVYRWTETNGACTGFDEVTIIFHEIPTVGALDETCDGTNTQFTVTFTVSGGTGPYTANGLAGTFSGNNFTSSGLNSTSNYAFTVVDANGCVSADVAGAKNCNCATDAGSVVATPATFCADQPATATWNNDATLDANDLIQYILHSTSGTTVGTVYATANQPSFPFTGNLQPGVVYYISAVAGDSLNGSVDLNDDCLSVTPGAPVQWKLLPTASLTGDATICTGGSTSLAFSGTGSFPLHLNYTIQNGDSSSVTLTGTQAFNLGVTPTATTTYILTNVVDGTLPACGVAVNDTVTVQVNSTIEAGVAEASSFFCRGANQIVQLAQQLVGADAGGVWTETSAVPSTSGAFNAAAATFNVATQAPGTYTFRYRIDAAAPCNDDEATVTVVINTVPIADAGADKTLDCNTTSVTLGGVNTTAATGITYQWTLDTAVVSTARMFATTLPGIYSLVVTGGTECSATDRTTVTLDASLPFALISKQGVHCYGDKNGSISVDSVVSGHPPVLFALNDGPFSSNPNFTSLPPGEYTISLQDANGCEWTSDPQTVTEPPQLIASLGADLNLSLGDSALVELQVTDSLSAVDTIIWLPLIDSAGINKPFQHWLPLATRPLGVQVVDINGCKATDRLLIIVDKIRHVYIPNIFAPGAAAGDEVVTVYGGRDVEEVEMFQIYDRWGEQLFERLNFPPNSEKDGWGGKFRSKDVDPGVYVYYVVVRFKDGERQIFAGDVTVMH